MQFYVDHYCEIPAVFSKWITKEFYTFADLIIDPLAVYIIGRVQLRDNANLVRQLVYSGTKIVFSNPAEGSETFVQHLRLYGVEDLVLSGLLPCIAGGPLPPEYSHMLFDHFLTQPLRYKENIAAQVRTNEIFSKTNKPYKYLFLNGRYRQHRRGLINLLDDTGLLKNALWTNLDAHQRPIRLLPEQYEVEQFRNNMKSVTEQGFIKNQLFNNLWGEIYIAPEPYIDTYFSLVTETVYSYPYSFRTEKIAKPLTMGHPFVAVANAGFYRDLHNIGFKTFGHIIDESFDNIDNDTDRMNAIVSVVGDLCTRNMLQFMSEAESVCKYNQQHLQQLHTQYIEQFPDQLFQFLKTHERFRV